MKFLCGNCKAKYQIADEKVTGRTLRMKCRRCGHDILIDGHSMQSAPPPPAPRRTSSTVSVVPGAARAASAMAAPANLPRPALGRPKPPSGLSADFRRHVVAPPEVPQRTAPYDLWHVAIQDVPVGPMTRDELARKVESGAVTAESLCWREGMDDWRPFGELPELQQLARRPREVRGPRTRPHSIPAPPPARPQVVPSDDDDDDAGEATRISEFMPAISQAGAPPFAAAPAANAPPSVAQPLPVASGPMQVIEPARVKGGSSGLTTGIAIGLLGGILLIGGPKLYQLAWGSTPEQKPASQPAIAVEKPAPPPEKVELPPEEPDEPEEEKVAARPAATGTRGPRTNKSDAPDKPKALSDEQRRLLERMGGGGNDPDLRGVAPARSDHGGGGPVPAALTPQQLTKVVQDNKNQLQRCYETALRAAGGKQEGAVKIKVSVVVGTSGTTKTVNTEGDGLGNMTDCIRSSVKRWRFPLASGDSEFAFPLVFQPGA